LGYSEPHLKFVPPIWIIRVAAIEIKKGGKRKNKKKRKEEEMKEK
jgi:hypothetical protein